MLFVCLPALASFYADPVAVETLQVEGASASPLRVAGGKQRPQHGGDAALGAGRGDEAGGGERGGVPAAHGIAPAAGAEHRDVVLPVAEADAAGGVRAEDALERARVLGGRLPAGFHEAIARMELKREDSIAALKNLDYRPDVVLLDPMFPERKKSALVKKKLQLIQLLEAPCDDEEALIEAAIGAHPKRIIVKRPPKGPYLAGIKPSFSLTGKAVRIDCIVLPD